MAEYSAFSLLRNALSGRYAIERELGHGGMATVYLARDVRHDRAVAVKVVERNVAPAGAERFAREIRTAARLTHPHVLGVHDSGEADGLLYYVMPYVEGESLRDRLTREKRLSVDEALRMVDALQFHTEHGEVCPANWNKGKEGMQASAEGVAKYLAANASKL